MAKYCVGDYNFSELVRLSRRYEKLLKTYPIGKKYARVRLDDLPYMRVDEYLDFSISISRDVFNIVASGMTKSDFEDELLNHWELYSSEYDDLCYDMLRSLRGAYRGYLLKGMSDKAEIVSEITTLVVGILSYKERSECEFCGLIQ